ncbi:MAG TPA: hypothetical protein PK593_10815 [Thermomicrobiales bacterium]|nr:hypothetical protein [Chloroflexota bacterium]HQX63937.1 hypothetical protein [Thermomicrobiales bacterium]HQZ90543.1 hypothetical protein [Thermomicrobiales bacterium]HRA32117.1 hypothetical protein [Thermomicrobiales bacterium]
MASQPRVTDGRVPLAPVGLIVVSAGILGLAAGAAAGGTSLSPLTWYLARASGLTLYLLLWLSVVSGLAMTTKLPRALAGGGQSWLMHRVTSELAIVMLGLHILSLAFDPTVPLGMLGVLVPFASDVRQPWTDLGIFAAWGLLAITGSFAVRGLLGRRGWALLHRLTFPLWAVALAHAIGAGSDSRQIWAAAFYGLTTAAVVFLTSYRLLRLGQRGQGPVSMPGPVRDRERMRAQVERYRQVHQSAQRR